MLKKQPAGGKAGAKEAKKEKKESKPLKQKKPPKKPKIPKHHVFRQINSSTEIIQKNIDYTIGKLQDQPNPQMHQRWIFDLLGLSKLTEQQRLQVFRVAREGVPMRQFKSQRENEAKPYADPMDGYTFQPELLVGGNQPRPKYSIDLNRTYWNAERAVKTKEAYIKKRSEREVVDETAGGLYRAPAPIKIPHQVKNLVSDAAHKMNMIEDTGIYARMISHYVSKGEWDKAFDITNKMKEDDKINVGAYYHMLRQALEHAPEKVDVIVQDMKEIGIDNKNAQVYARYISFYDSKDQLDKMLEILEQMKKEGVVPTAQSFTRIVTRYLRDRDYAKVLETHKDMKGYNLQLTAYILPTFLDEFMSSTLPEPIYLRIGKDMRDQPGKFITYAGHLRNIQDTARLEALDVLRKRLTLNAGFDFKHAWKNHTVPRISTKKPKEKSEGEGEGEGEGEKEKAAE